MKALVSKSSNLYSFVSGEFVNVNLTEKWINDLLSTYNVNNNRCILIYNKRQQKDYPECYLVNIEYRCSKDDYNSLYGDLLVATASSSFYKDKEYQFELEF